MCDYSLMAFANRLAVPGEDLVVYRFSSGAAGLASAYEIQASREPAIPKKKGLWPALVGLFEMKEEPRVPAVCVPPGTLLLLRDIPASLMQEYDVLSNEQVTFTQATTDAYSYRDSVRFRNGRQISLQALQEGQRVRNLDQSGGISADSFPEIPAFVGQW